MPVTQGIKAPHQAIEDFPEYLIYRFVTPTKEKLTEREYNNFKKNCRIHAASIAHEFQEKNKHIKSYGFK